jgi:hypothetical protein
VNYARQNALHQAMIDDRLLPLEDLIGTHAGQVVNRSHEQISLFYAQCWAFARFIREADRGRYRDAIGRMLADAAAGNLVGDQSPKNNLALWNPRSARPVLEYYLGMELPEIDKQYRLFVSKIANLQGG